MPWLDSLVLLYLVAVTSQCYTIIAEQTADDFFFIFYSFFPSFPSPLSLSLKPKAIFYHYVMDNKAILNLYVKGAVSNVMRFLNTQHFL